MDTSYIRHSENVGRFHSALVWGFGRGRQQGGLSGYVVLPSRHAGKFPLSGIHHRRTSQGPGTRHEQQDLGGFSRRSRPLTCPLLHLQARGRLDAKHGRPSRNDTPIWDFVSVPASDRARVFILCRYQQFNPASLSGILTQQQSPEELSKGVSALWEESVREQPLCSAEDWHSVLVQAQVGLSEPWSVFAVVSS